MQYDIIPRIGFHDVGRMLFVYVIAVLTGQTEERQVEVIKLLVDFSFHLHVG